ncbi:ExbD/TolR family protein [Marinobacter mobilis]|uniref:Outer membrane transport energization protein ExbD (TC 2.C.1.1.1) n=1 Tax=Marinobacter mobilis TaxID=488533 RepID=A0A1H3C7M3_9GAMM|nr:biopolymer transporter ExbD [Marinobacter mobilis]SDX50133.1 outer membrane transport energization protein ExbD (TC 2.C.1.1.1) [Marinobacter mobilis]
MTPLLDDRPGSQKTLLDRVEDSLLPLINLVFLLLMFFIVAGKLAETPLPELPAAQAEQDRQAPTADLVVQADGRWLADNQTVTATTLSRLLPPPDTSQPLRVAAAGEISMADLEALLQKLEQEGYQQVLLLTEPAS